MCLHSGWVRSRAPGAELLCTLHPHLLLQLSLLSKPHWETAAGHSGVAYESPFQVLFSSQSGALGQSLSFALSWARWHAEKELLLL